MASGKFSKISSSKETIKKRMSSLKSNKNRVHVISQQGGWAVKSEGDKKSIKIFEKKSDAIARAQAIANKRKTKDIIVHKKDGRIEERKSEK